MAITFNSVSVEKLETTAQQLLAVSTALAGIAQELRKAQMDEALLPWSVAHDSNVAALHRATAYCVAELRMQLDAVAAGLPNPRVALKNVSAAKAQVAKKRRAKERRTRTDS